MVRSDSSATLASGDVTNVYSPNLLSLASNTWGVLQGGWGSSLVGGTIAGAVVTSPTSVSLAAATVMDGAAPAVNSAATAGAATLTAQDSLVLAATQNGAALTGATSLLLGASATGAFTSLYGAFGSL